MSCPRLTVATTLALGLSVVACAAVPRPKAASDEPPATPAPSSTSSAAASLTAPASSGKPPTAEELATLNAELIDAAWDNDLKRVEQLIRRGADVNHKDKTVQSAYLISTSEGYLDLLELTLTNGAKVNDKDSYNGTGLIRAADRGHADIVGRLIQAGIDRDHVNRLGWTALHEAVILGNGSRRYVDTVRVLVAAGVDVTIATARDGMTALQHAEQRGYSEIARVLRRVNETMRNPSGALLAAASAGDADTVAVALRSRAERETRDSRRGTPLLLAVTNDRLAAARVLVYLGADPDALDDQHDTPWLVTGVTGSVPMAELLLTVHPDLTIRNRFGGLSIIPASERGHVDYVRLVAKTGIDINHVNNLGWTALLEAVILGKGTQPWQEIVRILLANGADPSIADKDGVTALEHARSRGYDEIARILKQRG